MKDRRVIGLDQKSLNKMMSRRVGHQHRTCNSSDLWCGGGGFRLKTRREVDVGGLEGRVDDVLGITL